MDKAKVTITAPTIHGPGHADAEATSQEDTQVPRLRRSARILAKRPRKEFEEDDIRENDPAPSAIVVPTSPIDIPPSSPSVRRASRPVRTQECLSCGEDFPQFKMTLAPCSHWFCRPCLDHFVNLAMKDESIFPAQCCNTTIPVTIRNHFSKELVARYNAKRVEFEVPGPERVYCSGQLCSAFIPPKQIHAGVAHCTHCLSDTCTTCKEKAHKGVCPDDKNSQDVFRLAESSKWKRCGQCGHVIEKADGCNHMRCVCGHNFCYKCGKGQQECICHLANHPHLPLNVRVAIDEWGVDGWDEDEDDDEPCIQRWNRLFEPSNCQDCNRLVQGYNIFVCRACSLTVCLACRANHRGR